MHHRTLETAPKIAAQINLSGARTLLDLGGGPGTYAMAFLAKNPALRATVCDRPAALDVAKEIASTHKAGARLSYLPLDVMVEDIPDAYDVIWYSNVLHIYSPQENQAVFQRAATALNPEGRLLIQDAFLHDRDGLFPEEASLFAVSMLLFTESGNTYKAADTKGWLTDAGFERVRVLRMKKGTEDLGGRDTGSADPWSECQNARPPNRIRNKFTIPLITLKRKKVDFALSHQDACDCGKV